MGTTTRMFDMKSREKNMKTLHNAHVARSDFIKMKTKGAVVPDVFDLKRAIARMWKRAARKLGLLNKYRKPHQGPQECARRARQRANGHDLSDPLTRARFA